MRQAKRQCAVSQPLSVTSPEPQPTMSDPPAKPAESGPGATYYTPMHPGGVLDTSRDLKVRSPCACVCCSNWGLDDGLIFPRAAAAPCAPLLAQRPVSLTPRVRADRSGAVQLVCLAVERRVDLDVLHLVHDSATVQPHRLCRHMLSRD